MKLRILIVACVIVALFAALWAALVRVGWKMPALPVPLAGQHGALMISAFLGTLISLERAVALQKKWAYAAPALSAAGGLALIAGLPAEIGRGLCGRPRTGRLSRHQARRRPQHRRSSRGA
jgi:hypothetical protein